MFGGITNQHDHDITGASLYLHVQASKLTVSSHPINSYYNYNAGRK